MNQQVRDLVAQLDLAPHPEGGFFRESFRSGETVIRDKTSVRRAAMTSIYFLLGSDQHSRWHSVAADEQWTFLAGDPLEIFTTPRAGGLITRTRLGPIGVGVQPTFVVPAGTWQAARPTGQYGLVTCTVAPGFEFADFEFLADNPTALAEITVRLGDARALL